MEGLDKSINWSLIGGITPNLKSQSEKQGSHSGSSTIKKSETTISSSRLIQGMDWSKESTIIDGKEELRRKKEQLVKEMEEIERAEREITRMEQRKKNLLILKEQEKNYKEKMEIIAFNRMKEKIRLGIKPEENNRDNYGIVTKKIGKKHQKRRERRQKREDIIYKIHQEFEKMETGKNGNRDLLGNRQDEKEEKDMNEETDKIMIENRGNREVKKGETEETENNIYKFDIYKGIKELKKMNEESSEEEKDETSEKEKEKGINIDMDIEELLQKLAVEEWGKIYWDLEFQKLNEPEEYKKSIENLGEEDKIQLIIYKNKVEHNPEERDMYCKEEIRKQREIKEKTKEIEKQEKTTKQKFDEIEEIENWDYETRGKLIYDEETDIVIGSKDPEYKEYLRNKQERNDRKKKEKETERIKEIVKDTSGKIIEEKEIEEIDIDYEEEDDEEENMIDKFIKEKEKKDNKREENKEKKEMILRYDEKIEIDYNLRYFLKIGLRYIDWKTKCKKPKWYIKHTKIRKELIEKEINEDLFIEKYINIETKKRKKREEKTNIKKEIIWWYMEILLFEVLLIKKEGRGEMSRSESNYMEILEHTYFEDRKKGSRNNMIQTIKELMEEQEQEYEIEINVELEKKEEEEIKKKTKKVEEDNRKRKKNTSRYKTMDMNDNDVMETIKEIYKKFDLIELDERILFVIRDLKLSDRRQSNILLLFVKEIEKIVNWDRKEKKITEEMIGQKKNQIELEIYDFEGRTKNVIPISLELNHKIHNETLIITFVSLDMIIEENEEEKDSFMEKYLVPSNKDMSITDLMKIGTYVGIRNIYKDINILWINIKIEEKKYNINWIHKIPYIRLIEMIEEGVKIRNFSKRNVINKHYNEDTKRNYGEIGDLWKYRIWKNRKKYNQEIKNLVKYIREKIEMNNRVEYDYTIDKEESTVEVPRTTGKTSEIINMEKLRQNKDQENPCEILRIDEEGEHYKKNEKEEREKERKKILGNNNIQRDRQREEFRKNMEELAGNNQLIRFSDEIKRSIINKFLIKKEKNDNMVNEIEKLKTVWGIKGNTEERYREWINGWILDIKNGKLDWERMEILADYIHIEWIFE